MRPRLLRLYDLLERAAWTFSQAFAATAVITGKLDVLDLKIAVAAGVFAVLKWISIGASVATGEALAAQPTTLSFQTSSSTASGPGNGV